MTTISFVRHGKTHWNNEGRNAGQIDIKLSNEGRLQSVYLAKRLMTNKWDNIYSSDLARAKETAQLIAAYNDLISINLDSRLRARHRGKTQGMTEDERVQKWGENWMELDLDSESDAEISQRGLMAFNEIVSKNYNKNIIIVTHGGIITTIMDALNLKKSPLKTSSLTIIEKVRGNWELKLYNCRNHLTENNKR